MERFHGQTREWYSTSRCSDTRMGAKLFRGQWIEKSWGWPPIQCVSLWILRYWTNYQFLVPLLFWGSPADAGPESGPGLERQESDNRYGSMGWGESIFPLSMKFYSIVQIVSGFGTQKEWTVFTTTPSCGFLDYRTKKVVQKISSLPMDIPSPWASIRNHREKSVFRACHLGWKCPVFRKRVAKTLFPYVCQAVRWTALGAAKISILSGIRSCFSSFLPGLVWNSPWRTAKLVH